MRFRIRDLMLATTVVALYAATGSWIIDSAGIRSSDALNRDLFASIAIIVLGLAMHSIPKYLELVRAYRDAGPEVVSWPVGNRWFSHVLFPAVFVFQAAILRSIANPVSLLFISIMPLTHAAIICSQNLREFYVGEHGIAFRQSFIPWNHCKLSFDEANKTLLVSSKLPGMQFPLGPSHTSIPIPVNKVEAVREAIAKYQPATH